MSMNKNNLIMKMFSKSLVELPSPTSISYWWNSGSLCGLCLVIQILSGLFLSMHYSCSASLAFESVSHIMRDMNSGWVIRLAHVNGSSFFFIMLYLHIGRSLYYGGYFKKSVWCVGVTILLMVMAISFLGYVLPWGQMSFWGATVITNLFSAIPYIGSSIVFWLWGGFAVDNDTLTRFFSLHFMLPFVLTAVVVVHLLYLHESGSSNPLGVNSNMDKVPFHPYFSKKDVLGIFVVILFLLSLSFLNPWLFMDVENFIPANPLVTPIHIQPEWYFLFAYSILRSIPSKLGGVIALISSIVILYTLPFYNFKSYNSLSFRPLGKKLFWFLIVIFILLTWNGSCPVEDPYVVIGQWLSFLYFSYFLALPLVSSLENKLLIS